MTEDNPQHMQIAKINKALGLFLLCFAGVILVAVFFTETLVGRLTNLTAGLILAAIGAVMVLKSGRRSPTP
jgi:Flp pilus assembly protein TadB